MLLAASRLTPNQKSISPQPGVKKKLYISRSLRGNLLLVGGLPVWD